VKPTCKWSVFIFVEEVMEMKRIVALIIILLLLVLSAAPVLANDEPQVIMQGFGRQIEFPPSVDANVGVNINTISGKIQVHISHPGGLVGPEGQRVTGRYVIGEIISWTTDGSSATVDIWGQMYLLPSHEPHGPSGEAQFIGVLKGQGKKGGISLVSAGGTLFTVPGTIIIR
jgi:hypothetical protein